MGSSCSYISCSHATLYASDEPFLWSELSIKWLAHFSTASSFVKPLNTRLFFFDAVVLYRVHSAGNGHPLM